MSRRERDTTDGSRAPSLARPLGDARPARARRARRASGARAMRCDARSPRPSTSPSFSWPRSRSWRRWMALTARSSAAPPHCRSWRSPRCDRAASVAPRPARDAASRAGPRHDARAQRASPGRRRRCSRSRSSTRSRPRTSSASRTRARTTPGVWHLLGEVEVVFGVWAMVLVLFMMALARPGCGDRLPRVAQLHRAAVRVRDHGRRGQPADPRARDGDGALDRRVHPVGRRRSASRSSRSPSCRCSARSSPSPRR